MKRKGFTLVELLVVIAIIALLMGILMPALARVRQLAFRMTCGTNLSGIGKAMLIYSNDYDDELPKAGGRTNDWVTAIDDWMAVNRIDAFDVSSGKGNTTVTSNFYLLVRYAEVTPKQFICKGETDSTEFKLSDFEPTELPDDFTFTDGWDFGPVASGRHPRNHCSYSYHWPFDEYSLTTSSDPSMAIAADRNPWFTDARSDSPMTFGDYIPDVGSYNGTSEQAKIGNSDAHQGDGQNVLFLDSHVQFEKRPTSGLNDDNIYTAGSSTDFLLGREPVMGGRGGGIKPFSREDSYLICEPPAAGR
jgi:prepilin-type N-terminal cleavage/methylation domain-containing protein